MVEPTESEDLAEIDRFIDAMIAIKAEADAVAAGDVARRRQPAASTRRTPPQSVDRGGVGRTPYTREQAVYPVPALVRHKYWPPVRRIDQAYGDRNLVCACPPIEAFA